MLILNRFPLYPLLRCLPPFWPPTLYGWRHGLDAAGKMQFVSSPIYFSRLRETTAAEEKNTTPPTVTKFNLIRSRSLWQFEIDIWGEKLLNAWKGKHNWDLVKHEYILGLLWISQSNPTPPDSSQFGKVQNLWHCSNSNIIKCQLVFL